MPDLSETDQLRLELAHTKQAVLRQQAQLIEHEYQALQAEIDRLTPDECEDFEVASDT